MSTNELVPPQPLQLRELPIAVVPQHYAHPGLSLAQIVGIAWARRRQTLAIFLSIAALGLVAVRLIPRTYEATASLMVNYEVYDPLGGKDFPTGLLGSYIATQIELMRSSNVLQPVIDRLHLTERKKYISGYKGDQPGLRQWVEKQLAKNLQVEQGRYGSHLVYVTYSAGEPREAAEVANAVADVYTEQQYQRQTGPASERAQSYARQLDELKSRVAKAQEQVTEFRQRTGLVDPDSKIDVDMELLSTLQQRLVEAQNSRRAAEARQSESGSVDNQALSSSLVQSLKTQLADEQAQMAQLRTSLGPRHPQILALQQQIDATRASLGAELRAYSSGISSEVAAARQLEQKLQQAVNEQRSKELTTQALHDEQAKYLLELESAQSVYKRALDGYDQIMFASSDHYTNVTPVGRAEPPPRPTRPNTLKSMFLVLLLGLVAGLGGPFLHELLLARRVRCRDDLERDHGMPVLAELFAEQRAGATT